MREGEIIGDRYALLRRLSATTTSEVWQGFDRDMGRLVAIKFLPADVEDSRRDLLVKMFRREAQILSLVDHPSIPSIYETSIHENEGNRSPYLVREMVQGASLNRVLSRMRPTTPQAVSIALQVTEALQAVHGHGIVHRDLKPSNLIVDESGVVHLLDFGIAQLTDGHPIRQRSVAGTPPYMAPEQVTTGQLDGRADVYALGCILYEMIAGRSAFVGESDSAGQFLQVRELPVPLREKVPEVPPGIDELVSRMLARSPRDRPGLTETLAVLRSHVPKGGVPRIVGIEGEDVDPEYDLDDSIPPTWFDERRLRDSTLSLPLDPTLVFRAALQDGFEEPRIEKVFFAPSPASGRWAGLRDDDLSGADEDVGPAVESLESALARLFIRLGPPPELVGNETTPVGSDGGGVAE
ncbi:hypothetical protein GCM10010329_61540 [Streptomyces spiroverticillatus]|uniref:non-specific serine/threonine protein kinase n=1 Tax=Streptomyces finlayi TaxID=67296 RepID=A0A918X724_9ACTN|nr:serine/threonine-protein kinase [Streptomyces finlayi]GHA30057.1 hypothetical protein GCM10010329_61540 [Streptomyces spiroverticillatus]GHD15127.1 hypothetical protein GCM10010334_74910 [Streptomyces finlayi]